MRFKAERDEEGRIHLEPDHGWPEEQDPYASPALETEAKLFMLDQDGHDINQPPEPADKQLPQPRPILPQWTQTKAGRRSLIGAYTSHTSRTALYHLVRIIPYTFILLSKAPRGLARTVGWIVRWVNDDKRAEAIDALRVTARENPSAADRYNQAVKEQNMTLLAKIATVIVGLAVAASIVNALAQTSPMIPIAGIPALFGIIGSWRRKIIQPAVYEGTKPRRPSDAIVTEALGNLGISALNSALKEDPDAIKYFGPPTRTGRGWRVELDLPAGVEVSEIIDKRSKLSSNLKRPQGCVWPERARGQHEGRLILFVSDRTMSETGPEPWPHQNGKEVDLFEPIHWGTDARGEPVTVPLMFASGIIGALPRLGKTFTLRLIMLAMALDTRCKLYVYNLKGGADFTSARHVAHSYRSGDSSEDQTVALADLRSIQIEMGRRYKALERLSLEEPQRCPEGKVTSELASDKTLALYPIGIVIDECQIWFSDSDHKAEFRKLCVDIVKRGPAVGIMMWLATQRVDKDSIPTDISSNAILRFCLKVMGQVENDMVLGTSAYKAGYRATQFDRTDLGVGYLAGEGSDPQIVKSAYVDGAQAEKVSLQARELREQSGWLTGLAAGIGTPDDSETSLVDDLAEAWPEDVNKASYEALAEALTARFPQRYADITAKQVSDRGRSLGLTASANSRGPDGKHSYQGFAKADIDQTLSERDK